MNELTQRITNYLSSGGLFNPEMADREAVRDLLIECREAFVIRPDCAGGMPCTDCPNKRNCQAGCVRQGEALERPGQKSAQRHPLDVQALYELQKVMADFGGDWPDVPGEQEVVRRAKMLSRLWKADRAALAAQPGAVGEHGALAERIHEAHDLSLDGEHRECRTALLRIASALAAAPTEAKPAQDAVGAERYRLLRRGQHWSAIDGIGNVLRGDDLDAAISAKKGGQS